MNLKVGIIGMGYIGVSHVEALRRISFVEVVAVADANRELAAKRAGELRIPKWYGTVEEMLADPEIVAVHNCTPNHLHAAVNEAVIKAGKHLLSEKPLATSSEESGRLLALLEQHGNLVAGVNFNYRMNPLVQEMRNKIKKGEIGPVRLVHGSYLQDWLLFDTDYNWRVDPALAGPSRCVADIGSHWMDTIQAVTGAKIVAVCADLAIVIPIRRKPKGQVETFALNRDTAYEEVTVETEDYGAVLFRMDNGAHGVFHVSEVSAGRGCHFNFEIDGAKASMQWNQENADQMWMGFRDAPNLQIMRDPNVMDPASRRYTQLAKGHPEGWNDAFRNNIMSFHQFILDGKIPGRDAADFATFADAHQIIRLTEAILESARSKGWVDVPPAS